MPRLCMWALGYGLRRRTALFVVLATMLLKIGLDVLKPWPMKFLVDHILKGEPMSDGVAGAVEFLPAAATPDNLLTWCVVATLVLFILGWLLALASACANLNFGQRMVYDLAGDLFAHLQRLSLRFPSRLP